MWVIADVLGDATILHPRGDQTELSEIPRDAENREDVLVRQPLPEDHLFVKSLKCANHGAIRGLKGLCV